MKVKASYSRFEFYTNVGTFHCPLCATDVPPSTQHRCANGKPVIDVPKLNAASALDRRNRRKGHLSPRDIAILGGDPSL